MKSVYKYAAESGVPVGFYLTAMSACVILSLHNDMLPMLLIPLAIGFPVLLAYFMKKMASEQPAYARFSALWLGGLYSVIFGVLICMLMSASYLTFISPGFTKAYVLNAIATLEQSGQEATYAATIDIMRRAIDRHLLPTDMEFITTMGWLTCFLGSLVSMATALILSRRNRNSQF